MQPHVMDDPIGRDLRRYQLALRLVAHQARTHTIYDLTGLTRHRLATLRKRWRVPEGARHRGPSPSSFTVFFHSPRARSEGAALALLCRFFAASACRPDRDGSPVDRLWSGERLCDIYESYRACIPDSDMEFEHVVLLAKGLRQGDLIAFGHCNACRCGILVDRLATAQMTCSHCRRGLESCAGPADRRESEIGPAVVQRELFSRRTAR